MGGDATPIPLPPSSSLSLLPLSHFASGKMRGLICLPCLCFSLPCTVWHAPCLHLIHSMYTCAFLSCLPSFPTLYLACAFLLPAPLPYCSYTYLPFLPSMAACQPMPATTTCLLCFPFHACPCLPLTCIFGTYDLQYPKRSVTW